MRDMSLVEDSAKRKERLKTLREKFGLNQGGEEDSKRTKHGDDEETALPKPIFQNNITVQTDNGAVIGRPLEVKDLVKDQLEAAKEKEIIQDVEFSNILPRKPDWDLKRDVEKRLQKLERRTQRAITELIRERLQKNEMSAEEVAASVNLCQAQNNT